MRLPDEPDMLKGTSYEAPTYYERKHNSENEYGWDGQYEDSERSWLSYI